MIRHFKFVRRNATTKSFFSEKRMNSMIKTAIEEVHFAREQSSKNGRKSSRQHGEMVIIKKSSRSPSSSPNGSPPNTSPITQLKSSPSHSPVMKRKEVKQNS